MRKRREISLFSISFLDLLSGALGAVIILYVAIPKNKVSTVEMKTDQNIVKALESDLKSSEKIISNLQEELQKSREQVAFLSKTQAPPPQEVQSGANLDIGFKFKGKNIVFIIDTSYSMTEEDRMGQVKAGIKMLITALSPQYKIDVVQFPYGEKAPFKTLWGTLKEANSMNKLDSFDFVYRLNPWGGTPTRNVLKFVLENYEGVSDIVLLSDGVPTLHNQNVKDDIFDILRMTREENKTKIQINAIGVGKDFIKDQTSDRYKFLHLLSEENRGFFVGF